MDSQPAATGIDLARLALNAARHSARAHGHTPAKRPAPTRGDTARRGRDAREPAPLTAVFTALVAAHGWTLGTAGGGLRERWRVVVGFTAVAHWHLAGYDPTTRRLRVIADSPAWAAQLRLHQRQILTDLDQLRPGTVTTIDIRTGPAPTTPQDQEPDDQIAWHNHQPASPPPVYQELRRQMREDAAARQIATEMAVGNWRAA
ncbi:DciA family protein [Kitasatospora sp. NPDC002040]|uniref:DciA family protein n=1 Tax=Kitasatospora sp. NPDC002040 TaxID=3154661 RepID=UPI00332BCDB1